MLSVDDGIFLSISCLYTSINTLSSVFHQKQAQAQTSKNWWDHCSVYYYPGPALNFQVNSRIPICNAADVVTLKHFKQGVPNKVWNTYSFSNGYLLGWWSGVLLVWWTVGLVYNCRAGVLDMVPNKLCVAHSELARPVCTVASALWATHSGLGTISTVGLQDGQH